MTLIALVHMSLDVLAESGYLNKCQHPGGAFNVVSSAKVAANLGYTARLTKAGGAESVMNKHSATTNSESMTRLIEVGSAENVAISVGAAANFRSSTGSWSWLGEGLQYGITIIAVTSPVTYGRAPNFSVTYTSL